jgi:hypothetical protein
MLSNHRALLLLGAFFLAPGCAVTQGLPGLAAEPAPPPGAIAVIPQPTEGYRADQVILVDGARFDARVYAMPGVTRMEMPTASENIVSVVRPERNETVTWIEGSTTVSERPVGHFGIDLRSPNLATFELAPLGPATVDGVAADRYGFRATLLGGGTQEGEFWLTPENVIVRAEGTVDRPDLSAPRRVEMRLENLQLGPQDPALFEPPGTPVDVTPQLFEEFTRPPEGLFVPPVGS